MWRTNLRTYLWTDSPKLTSKYFDWDSWGLLKDSWSFIKLFWASWVREYHLCGYFHFSQIKTVNLKHLVRVRNTISYRTLVAFSGRWLFLLLHWKFTLMRNTKAVMNNCFKCWWLLPEKGLKWKRGSGNQQTFAGILLPVNYCFHLHCFTLFLVISIIALERFVAQIHLKAHNELLYWPIWPLIKTVNLKCLARAKSTIVI